MASTLACMRSRGNMPSKIKYAHVDSRDVERAQPALERPLGALESAPAALRWWLLRADANGGGGGVERAVAAWRSRAVAAGTALSAWRARWRRGDRGRWRGGEVYCGTCGSFVVTR